VPVGIEGQAEHALRFMPGEFQVPSQTVARRRFEELLAVLNTGTFLVAHNAAFDLAFLAEALRRARIRSFALRAYCTLRLARALLPGLPRYDLAALGKALHLECGGRHVAVHDARAVAALFAALVRQGGLADEKALRALHGPPVRVGASSACSGVMR